MVWVSSSTTSNSKETASAVMKTSSIMEGLKKDTISDMDGGSSKTDNSRAGSATMRSKWGGEESITKDGRKILM